METNSKILNVLKKYWGYDSFRSIQEPIIKSVLDGNDTLGLMPTGGGKSITFQVPTMVIDGMTLVITPIISLMKDQVDNLRDRGIKATYLHSGLSQREMRNAVEKCIYGNCKFLYVSPERLRSAMFCDQIRHMPIKLIVVDEAHCISQWGYDFRPSFLSIACIREIIKDAPILALTATATPLVVDDIMEKLLFHKKNVFSMSFGRQNLSYIVRHCEDKPSQLLHILNNVGGSAIVYARNRAKTKETAKMLQFYGINADFYHAGLSIEDKETKQNKWKSGENRVIIATNAFGMGIDKPDVRLVVHIDFPSSLEEYYQEAGRAGRDGKKSYVVLLTTSSDKATLKRRISDAFPPKDFIKNVYDLVGVFLNVAVGDGYNQLYEFNFTLFCKTFKLPIIPTKSALDILTKAKYIEFIEEIESQSRVFIQAKKEDLYHLSTTNPNLDIVLQALLRQYTGLFADYVFINEDVISQRYGIKPEVIYDSLITLTKMHILHYVPRKRTPFIIFTTSREESRYVIIPRTVYEEHRARLEERIGKMIQYAFDKNICRENFILNYFGESEDSRCGRCDTCLQMKKLKENDLDQKIIDGILYMLSNKPRSLSEFIDTLSFPRGEIISIVSRLEEEGAIIKDDITEIYNKK